MIKDAEKYGPQWSRSGDQRITKVGGVIRLLRLDELPQLISVIKGEKSLIGPRPERPEFNLKLNKLIPNYNLRNKLMVVLLFSCLFPYCDKKIYFCF